MVKHCRSNRPGSPGNTSYVDSCIVEKLLSIHRWRSDLVNYMVERQGGGGETPCVLHHFTAGSSRCDRAAEPSEASLKVN